jgi:hypothetical protein
VERREGGRKLTNVLLFEFTWMLVLLQRLEGEELTSQMSLDEGGLFVSLYSTRENELYSLYL